MSEHTQGRLVVLNSFLVPVAHADRKLGGSSDPKRDHDEYAHYIADVKGKRDYHNYEANARRLSAAWNAFDGHSTEIIERCRVTEITSQSFSSVGSAKAVEVCTIPEVSELNAALALLRDVLAECDESDGMTRRALCYSRIKEYLDACDTLEGK